MIKLTNPNYCATIIEIKNLVPLEGCDFVQAAIIMGNQVIVSKEVKIGDLGLFFPVECQLTNPFLKSNNLYRKSDFNLDSTKTGYFEENGRIRCVKFRGNKSEGLFMPIKSINNLGLLGSDLKGSDLDIDLKVGDEFNEIFGIEICKKYTIPRKSPEQPGSRTKEKAPKKSQIVENQFRFHQDTLQLYRNLHRINPDSLISITYKLHGCVSEDTIINTDQGNFTIKYIVDNKLNVNIKAFDIETNQIVYVPIDEYYLLKNDGEWYEIELEDGTILKITGNNPVWLPELNCYRKAELLKVSDVLLVSE